VVARISIFGFRRETRFSCRDMIAFKVDSRPSSCHRATSCVHVQCSSLVDGLAVIIRTRYWNHRVSELRPRASGRNVDSTLLNSQFSDRSRHSTRNDAHRPLNTSIQHGGRLECRLRTFSGFQLQAIHRTIGRHSTTLNRFQIDIAITTSRFGGGTSAR
jgi:hypothetical protein